MWRGVASEQRLQVEGPIGLDHEVHPAAWDVHPRQCARVVDDLVGLHDHHTVVEGAGFGDRRGVLGVRSGVEVAVAVGLLRTQQHDMRGKVDEHAGIELDVGVDGADVHGAVLDHLRDPHALRPRVGQIQLGRYAALEQVEVFGPGHRRDQHVQSVEALRIAVGQCARKEVGLLLVVALQRDAVTGADDVL